MKGKTMFKCSELGNLQKAYVKRALDFVKLYASRHPIINSIKFNNSTRKVEIYFESLFSDCLKVSYKDFQDEKNGLINHALKFVSKSVKNPSEDDIAEANNYIAQKEYEYKPSEEYKHLGY